MEILTYCEGEIVKEEEVEPKTTQEIYWNGTDRITR